MKMIASDDEDEDPVIHRHTVPSFPASASEVPDTPPEEHSAPKPPPPKLCKHKALKWSVLDRSLCLECTGRGLGKQQDCYETCSRYYECEGCKEPEEVCSCVCF